MRAFVREGKKVKRIVMMEPFGTYVVGIGTNGNNYAERRAASRIRLSKEYGETLPYSSLWANEAQLLIDRGIGYPRGDGAVPSELVGEIVKKMKVAFRKQIPVKNRS